MSGSGAKLSSGPMLSWLQRRIQRALVKGLTHAYESVRVDHERYLLQLRHGHGLPIATYDGLFTLPVEHLDAIARSTVRAGMKLAAAEGAGFGLGGILTLVPDLGVLSVITLRTVQKLSLLYGFPINTDEENAELWVAMASAAGVDVGRELVEKEVVQRFVPRVIQRIAVEASADVVERWAARIVPVLSSVLGAGLNYYFVRAWGERAQRYFHDKHLRVREQKLRELSADPLLLPPSGS